MQKYLVELIGTFFFVLVIGLSGNPIAIGSALMVMVFAGGHISGGHYNPAVTLGVWLRGKMPAIDVPSYMLSQIAGAAVAAFVVGAVNPAVLEPKAIEIGPSLLVEFLGTFALVYVVLNVATAKGTEGNSFYGLAIGFTVLAMAFALGPISGGAFNPAVAVGASVMHAFAWANLWVFLLANFAAGGAAALVFRYVTRPAVQGAEALA